jgi:hypothetical protein
MIHDSQVRFQSTQNMFSNLYIITSTATDKSNRALPPLSEPFVLDSVSVSLPYLCYDRRCIRGAGGRRGHAAATVRRPKQISPLQIVPPLPFLWRRLFRGSPTALAGWRLQLPTRAVALGKENKSGGVRGCSNERSRWTPMGRD